MKITIALIGDYNESVTAHQAIPSAIGLAAGALNIDVFYEWVSTASVDVDRLSQFHAIWCVPASPYQDREGAFNAIQFARRHNIPFLGTCGGYQHAVLEYARNVLGFDNAENTEEVPDAQMPLISSLGCPLVEKTEAVVIEADSLAGRLYQSEKVDEDYHCSFAINPDYQFIFDNTELHFTGKSEAAEPRILEIPQHRFFLGTAFQPERSSLKNQVHPLVVGFLQAAVETRIAGKS